MDYTIRKARPEDAEGLAGLYLQFWEPHKNVDPLIGLKGKRDLRTHLAFARRDIKDMKNIIFVAVRGDRVLGYVEALVKKNERCFRIGRYGYFNSAVTDRAQRRRGIAKALTAEMLVLFNTREIEYIKANVYNTNRVALRTWKKWASSPCLPI